MLDPIEDETPGTPRHLHAVNKPRQTPREDIPEYYVEEALDRETSYNPYVEPFSPFAEKYGNLIADAILISVPLTVISAVIFWLVRR